MQQLFRKLLKEIYNIIKSWVLVVFDICTDFNYVTDRSSNKWYNHIINLFVYIKMGIFQLKSQIILSIKYSTEELIK